MTITFHPNGKIDGINNANFNSSLPSGHVIQTVVGTNGTSSSGSVTISSSSASSPTFLDSNCKVTITPQRSNSKILITWSAQIRVNPSSRGHFGAYYSPNSDMSSPTAVDKARGGSLDESYRTVSGGADSYIFASWSRIVWDETVSNTNVRYYNVGAYKSAGDMYYGDNGVALQLMAQEILV
tara:strand:- start:55 stop:600 length:546 start_codon:yes stop_codon:yes gene_type:complete